MTNYTYKVTEAKELGNGTTQMAQLEVFQRSTGKKIGVYHFTKLHKHTRDSQVLDMVEHLIRDFEIGECLRGECIQCGKELNHDLMALFTKEKICRTCINKNHRKAVK